MSKRIGLGILAAAIAAPLPAAAWDYPGHRIVGAVADLVLQQHVEQAKKAANDGHF